MPKPTRRRCSTAPPAPAPASISAPCCSTSPWAPRSPVPYRGAGPAMQDLIGGRIDYIAEQISTALPQIQGDAVKAIATLGARPRARAREPADRAGVRPAGPRLRQLG